MSQKEGEKKFGHVRGIKVLEDFKSPKLNKIAAVLCSHFQATCKFAGESQTCSAMPLACLKGVPSARLLPERMMLILGLALQYGANGQGIRQGREGCKTQFVLFFELL